MKEQIKETIQYLKKKGASYADIRRTQRLSQNIKVKNGNVEALSQNEDAGFGIRVLHNGAWGFAASSILTPAEFKRIANLALEIAKASATTKKNEVVLAENEVYKDKYISKFRIDPFAVPVNQKLDLLIRSTEILMKHPKIKVAEASMDFFKTEKIFANTDGSLIEQSIIESGAGAMAVAVEGTDAQWRNYPNSHGGNLGTRGYEFIEELKLLDNMERVRDEAVSLLSAEPCPSLETTIIISSEQMALQVHESCGHPIELDRVLGTEISLAGGSFMTLDKLRKLKYGSNKVNITADATVEGALGTFGYDDEGVKAQRTDIIKEGLFVGYLTSRETAPVLGQKSNGTMRADGWNRLPLIRMTNINLEPGDANLEDLIADTKDGILLGSNKSWSIDDKRLNFQFGLEIAWEIKDGRLTGKVYKNPIYTGITPEFWNKCDAVCDWNYWKVWGVPNCGKGEPIQTMHVAHGTSPARFHKVQVGVSK